MIFYSYFIITHLKFNNNDMLLKQLRERRHSLPLNLVQVLKVLPENKKQFGAKRRQMNIFFRFIVLALSRFMQSTQPMHIRSALS